VSFRRKTCRYAVSGLNRLLVSAQFGTVFSTLYRRMVSLHTLQALVQRIDRKDDRQYDADPSMLCYIRHIMAIGTSGRIVLEIDPDLKRKLYASLALEQMTLKDWFIGIAKNQINNAQELPGKLPKKK